MDVIGQDGLDVDCYTGMEIEEISERSPEAIIRSTVEPAGGLTSFQAREIAFALGLDAAQVTRAVTALLGCYRAFRDLDATMVEINPLVATTDGPSVRASVTEIGRYSPA